MYLFLMMSKRPVEEVDCGGERMKVKREKCEVCSLDKLVNNAHATVHAVIV